MDPIYTDTRSKFYGVGKGCTCEWLDTMQDVGFRDPRPCLSLQPTRVVSLLVELAFTFNAINQIREQVKQHIGPTLERMVVRLARRLCPCTVEYPSFISILDVVLREMDLLQLEKCASSCRDMCEQLIAWETKFMTEVCRNAMTNVIKSHLQDDLECILHIMLLYMYLASKSHIHIFIRTYEVYNILKWSMLHLWGTFYWS